MLSTAASVSVPAKPADGKSHVQSLKRDRLYSGRKGRPRDARVARDEPPAASPADARGGRCAHAAAAADAHPRAGNRAGGTQGGTRGLAVTTTPLNARASSSHASQAASG